MAIVGKIWDLKESVRQLFKDEKDFKRVYDYLDSACVIEGEIYTRILNTNGEVSHDLGNEIRAIEQSYQLKEDKDAFFESHIKFVDFQLIVAGAEFFALSDKNSLEIKTPLDSSRDLIVYNAPNLYTKLYLDFGSLAIFYDKDIHAGGLGYGIIENKGGKVFKSVLKVPRILLR